MTQDATPQRYTDETIGVDSSTFAEGHLARVLRLERQLGNNRKWSRKATRQLHGTMLKEIQAAEREIWLDALEVEVHAIQDFRSGQPGFEDVPRWPHQVTYTVTIESDEPDERIRELHRAVEEVCPILNLLVNPQTITGSVTLNGREGVSTLTKGPAEVVAVAAD